MDGSARILIIDDDQSMLRLVRTHLTSAGFEVATASNGEEGLHLAESFRPKVIILDLLLPGMDGFVLCRHIRQNPLLAEARILMVTAVFLSEEDIVHGFTLGADQYLVKPDVILSKPIHLHELRAAVEKLLGPESGEEAGTAAALRDRVLLVDDDDRNLRLLRMRFASEGYEVAEALSGPAALALAEEFLPQVILLDVQMPQMSGIDVLKALREKGYDIPVVIMTAHGNEAVAVDAFKSGASDYLVKPIDSALAVRLAGQLIENYRLKKSQEKLTSRLKKISCDLMNRVNHLENQNRKLEEAYAQVRGLSEFNRRFIRSLSQDLRSPLSTLLSFLGLLRDTPEENRDKARERESIDLLFRTAFRLDMNLSNLLYSSRIQTGALVAAAGIVELEPAVEGVLHLARRSIGRPDLRFSWYPESKRHRISGDSALLRDILLNLLDNAVQRIEGVGEVAVEVLLPAPEGAVRPTLHLRIRDTGTRFSDTQLAAMEVVETGVDSLRDGTEVMHLSLCALLAKMQGWRLTLANRPQGGGEAVLEIPLHA